MNENSSSTQRPSEVQLGTRPGQLSPAPASYLTCDHITETAPWPYPGPASEADRCNYSSDIPMGTPEWVPSAETILESYQGTVVVIEVGKDSCLPTRPSGARGF